MSLTGANATRAAGRASVGLKWPCRVLSTRSSHCEDEHLMMGS